MRARLNGCDKAVLSQFLMLVGAQALGSINAEIEFASTELDNQPKLSLIGLIMRRDQLLQTRTWLMKVLLESFLAA
jgi:hypothetical protein